MSSYATQPTSQYSGVQPKFKDCVFDSSKEPAAFRVWLRLISGLVMSIAHGVWLETFLDNFLGRNPFQSSTRPAFLNDPALALDDSPQGNNTFPSPMPPTSESGGNSPLPSFDRATTQSRDGSTEAINPKQYRDLPEEAMSLDKALFNIITTIVKGSYLSLCIDLTGENARYTFAIIAMYKHAALTASNRRMVAMTQMADLKYHGDPGVWKLDFISRCREVYASGATIEHFMMQAAFKSMANLSHVQALMANDMNTTGVIGTGMNLEAIANKYTMFLATMSVDKINLNPTLNVDEKRAQGDRPKAKMWCENHKSTTHNTADCRNPPRDPPRDDDANQDQSEETNAAPKNQKCAYCERRSHTTDKCWLKDKHERAQVDDEMKAIAHKQAHGIDFAGRTAAPKKDMTQEQLSNLFKELVPRRK
jgi:hypothetical protein